jgi:NADPH-ferrihemoprotein reductase
LLVLTVVEVFAFLHEKLHGFEFFMQEFPSAKPSLGVFFACLAPRMRPRYYSISSSPLATPRALSITAAVVDSVTPCGRRHRGVATTHLASLHASPGVNILGAVRTSTFRLPRDASVPVVMVGPGTGLAPFRGFLQERACMQASGEKLGPALLFFGCRHPEHDYIYQDELEVRLNSAAFLQSVYLWVVLLNNGSRCTVNHESCKKPRPLKI